MGAAGENGQGKPEQGRGQPHGRSVRDVHASLVREAPTGNRHQPRRPGLANDRGAAQAPGVHLSARRCPWTEMWAIENRLSFLRFSRSRHQPPHGRIVQASHDQREFEVFVYSYGNDDGSWYRRRIEREAEHFIDVKALNSEARIAGRIHDDGIHILVDLKGHTGLRRDWASWRCAPRSIQVNYMGFAGPMGSAGIRRLHPQRRAGRAAVYAGDYRESWALLPNSYYINDHEQPVWNTPVSRATEGLPERGSSSAASPNLLQDRAGNLGRLDEPPAEDARTASSGCYRPRPRPTKTCAGKPPLAGSTRPASISGNPSGRRNTSTASAWATCSSTRPIATPTPRRATHCGSACRSSRRRAKSSPAAWPRAW